MPGESSGMPLFYSVGLLISISLGCMAQCFMLIDGLLLTESFQVPGFCLHYITVYKLAVCAVLT